MTGCQHCDQKHVETFRVFTVSAWVVIRKKEKKINKVGVSSKSAEVPRGPWQEVRTAHAWKTLTGARRELFLTSTLPLLLNGPFFQRTCPPKSLTWCKAVFPLAAVSITSNPRLKTLNNEHIYLKTTSIFLILCLGATTISFVFRKNSFSHRMVVEHRNKVRIY